MKKIISTKRNANKCLHDFFGVPKNNIRIKRGTTHIASDVLAHKASPKKTDETTI